MKISAKNKKMLHFFDYDIKVLKKTQLPDHFKILIIKQLHFWHEIGFILSK